MLKIMANQMIDKIKERLDIFDNYNEEFKLLNNYLQKINFYSDSTNNTDINSLMDILNKFINVLDIEKNVRENNKHYQYLREVSFELESQMVRKNDVESLKQGVLFLTKTVNGNDIFFITRNHLSKYLKDNNLQNENVTLVDEPEIDLFLSVIKRFFGKKNFITETINEALDRDIADYNYLKNFANTINEQEVRESDYEKIKTGAIFKLTLKHYPNTAHFFITRKDLNSHIKSNNLKLDDYSIDILTNSELNKIIDILVADFSD